jgi:hypothetical protein
MPQKNDPGGEAGVVRERVLLTIAGYLFNFVRRFSSPRPTGLPTRVIAQRKPMVGVLWRSSRWRRVPGFAQ